MARYFLILFFFGSSLLKAQDQRYYVQVQDLNNPQLIATLTGAGIALNVVRNLNYPNLGLNAVAISMDPGSFGQVRNILDATYGPNTYLFTVDLQMRPDEGSGDDPGLPVDTVLGLTNAALDDLVPTRPILSPLAGPLTGDILVDIVGTGIDQAHSQFTGLTFETPISVMPGSGGANLPGNVDLHNHETRLAGCIAGEDTGLLSALGTATLAKYRSVLFYDHPPAGPPGSATAFTSDALAALAEVTLEHEFRLAAAYLKNHGAVLCYSHSVIPSSGSEERVGQLEARLDYAWERGIFTSISAGNRPIAASSTSPAGAGEWIAYNSGGTILTKRYWPLFGSPTYALPSPVGFETSMPGSEFHLKSGAHDIAVTPAPWFVSAILGSALNTANPAGFGPAMNHGVDLFAPGEDIPVPATRMQNPPAGGFPTTVIDGITYSIERGFQEGNGTSYSAAYTAGLATRILQLRPWASNAQVRQAILDELPVSGLETLTIPDLSSLSNMSLTYEDWIARYDNIAPFGYFLGGLDGELADPDGDGIPNITEYHCGMDPRHKDAQHSPTMSVDEDELEITVSMQVASYLPSPAVVDWHIESSTDLDTWMPEGKGDVTNFPETALSGDGTGIQGVVSFTTAAPKKFYRVAIYTIP